MLIKSHLLPYPPLRNDILVVTSSSIQYVYVEMMRTLTPVTKKIWSQPNAASHLGQYLPVYFGIVHKYKDLTTPAKS
jgi:hypothetical protein